MDASISIPFFKIWIDIHRVPLELCTDTHMARLVSSFGIFLSSMELPNHSDYQTCSFFVATNDLSLIPYEIDLRIRGMVYTASVSLKKWLKKQVYQSTDTPLRKISYSSLSLPTSPSSSRPSVPPVNPIWFQGDDVMPMSLKALREIFKHFSSADLLENLAACLAKDKAAIAANHAAYRA